MLIQVFFFSEEGTLCCARSAHLAHLCSCRVGAGAGEDPFAKEEDLIPRPTSRLQTKDSPRSRHMPTLTKSWPPGLHTTAKRAQTCTFEGPGLQKLHQNSTRRTPREEERKKFAPIHRRSPHSGRPFHPDVLFTQLLTRPKTCHPKTVSPKTHSANQSNDNFVQTRVHQKTFSSKHTFVQNIVVEGLERWRAEGWGRRVGAVIL